MALRPQDIDTLDQLIEEQDRVSEAIASDSSRLERIENKITEAQDKLSWVLSVLKTTDEAYAKANDRLQMLLKEEQDTFKSVNQNKLSVIDLQNEIELLRVKRESFGGEVRKIEKEHNAELVRLKEEHSNSIKVYDATIQVLKSSIASLEIDKQRVANGLGLLEQKIVELNRDIVDKQNILNVLNDKYIKLLGVDEELKNKQKDVKLTEQKLNSLKLQIKLEREHGKNSD